MEAAKERYAKAEVDRQGGVGLDEEAMLDIRNEIEQRREPENEDGVSFTRLRVTDFFSNKRVSQPPRLGEEDEIRVESKKGKVLELAREYREEVRLVNNLTEKEELGRQEIAEGVKNKDWRLYSTDKSGKLVLDTNEKYLRTQEKHVGVDREVGIEEVRVSEELLYQNSKDLVKIFEVGREAGENQQDRISESMKVERWGGPSYDRVKEGSQGRMG